MSLIDDIKSRLDLVEVASELLELKRSGKNWVTLCPFHPDHTPSLVVFPGSQRWKCFGASCNKGGDLIDLAQMLWDETLPVTLRRLAERAGVPLAPPNPAQQAALDRQRAQQQLLSALVDIFHDLLFDSDPLHGGLAGCHYARARGWSDETLQAAHLGFCAPKHHQHLAYELKQRGHDPLSPHAVALLGFTGDVKGWAAEYGIEPPRAWEAGGKIPGLPFEMLIYPHLARGRVTYLSGRAVIGKGHWNPPAELFGPRQPYYNHLWWASATASAPADPATRLVIVEGQANAVSLGQLGLPAVALGGLYLAAAPEAPAVLSADAGSPAVHSAAALSADAVHSAAALSAGPLPPDSALLPTLLDRCARGASLYLGLDSDEPGRAAVARSAQALLSGSVKPNRLFRLDWPAKDANQWLVNGASAEMVADLLAESPSWVDCLVEAACSAKSRLASDGGIAEMRQLFSALACLDEFELASCRSRILDRLHLSKADYKQLLQFARKTASQEVRPTPALPEGELSQYLVSGGCIHYLNRLANGEERMQALCNFFAQILEEIERSNGLDVVREFRIAGELQGKPLPEIIVKAAEFGNMDWVIKNWGARAIIEPGAQRRDRLRNAIQVLSPNIRQRTIYSHTGWTVLDGQRHYLSASGALGREGVEVDLDHDLRHYSLPSSPAGLQDAIAASLSFLDLAPLRVTAPLWGAVWLAPLRDLVNMGFSLWVYGSTGTLKSTLCALALNHYGAGFDEKHMPATFIDTVNRIEHKIFTVKDSLMVVDDFAPQKDQRMSQEIMRIAQRLARAAGNLTGRGRLGPDSTARLTFFPRSLMIITGEDLLDNESSLARLYVIDMLRGDVSLVRLTPLQNQRHLLAHAMGAYLLDLGARWDDLGPSIKDRWSRYRQLARQDGLHMRVPEAAAGLMLGFELGLQNAVRHQVISQYEFESLLANGKTAILEGAARMAERVNNEKPERLFLQSLRELFAAGKVWFEYRGCETRPILGGPEERGEMVGYYDDENIYLIPSVTYARVARHFRDQGASFPVSDLALRKMLAEAGELVNESSGSTGVKWIKGRNQRTLILHRSVLGEDLDQE